MSLSINSSLKNSLVFKFLSINYKYSLTYHYPFLIFLLKNLSNFNLRDYYYFDCSKYGSHGDSAMHAASRS